MNKPLVVIIVLAALLRFYQLGANPPSLSWDEASLGYNAYSILKTGADEYGRRLPLSIRSFDDFKPPLYVYLTVPAVVVFGLNEFAVRFPSALLGVLTVLVTYFLAKELFSKQFHSEVLALFTSFFLAISPWHLQFSRAAFEGNIGLFFLMLGWLLFFYGLKRGGLLLLSSLSFVFSLYSYHSFRLLIPLFAFFLGILFWRELIKTKFFFLSSVFLLIIFSAPIYLSFVAAQGSGSRLSTVTVFSDPQIINPAIRRLEYDRNANNYLGSLLHNRRIVFGLAMVKGYLDHFGPDFLFLHGDGGVQHHSVEMGMLYLWDLPFILFGLYFLLNKRNRYLASLFILFMLAPLPASITTGTPHPVRAISMMPCFHLFAASGVAIVIIKLWQSKRFLLKVFSLGAIVISLVINIFYYLHQYYVHTPIEYGYFWQYGYKEIIQYAKEHEQEFAKIIITYEYDQPYIYYLFYNKIDPSWYQKNWDYRKTGLTDRFRRVIGKYEFRDLNYSQDALLPNALLIGTPQEIPENAKILKEVKFPDGRIAFRIAKT